MVMEKVVVSFFLIDKNNSRVKETRKKKLPQERLVDAKRRFISFVWQCLDTPLLKGYKSVDVLWKESRYKVY